MNYFLSVIIPIYNEHNIIESSLKRITSYLSQKKYNYQLILVNDCSKDNSLSIIENFKNNFDLQTNNCEILIIKNAKNMGKGFSVREGMIASKGEYVLFSDADLSSPIEESEKMLKCLQEGFNITIGNRNSIKSRLVKKQSKIRKLSGKVFNLFVKIVTKMQYDDTQCGFKCFDRFAIDKISQHLKINDFSFDVEILYLAFLNGLKVKEIPIVWENNENSKVKIISDSIKMFKSLMNIKKIHANLLIKN
jgi:dolichyl-phosphate beta-glucosyltransferase